MANVVLALFKCKNLLDTISYASYVPVNSL